ncbi:hypothetical protein CLOM_g9651 [Closterium sp. NIES-68]|nr:hypothetical protein CLOM_g6078 [Closterium sp. NIES-68]GJP50486.1 hypothetical protein CLOM_g9651 [Closterium sp. NIES-68]GJP58493.1 hypothetical protein CLOP_g353 [Closterium sp. NIES-67]GJP79281.1 hypothetical protein CLOP_g9532 [Closterium sp. NIES-67]
MARHHASPSRLGVVFLALFAALFAALLAEPCSADGSDSPLYDGKTGAKKLIAGMKKKGYNTALSLFESTGIAKELPTALSYYRLTILAPTDEAFAKLPASATKGLSKAALRDLAMLHIVKGRRDAATLVRMQREHEWRTPSKNGEAGLFKSTEMRVKPVKLHAEGGKNVTITKPDSLLLTISAVHGIDRVIVPGGKLTGPKKNLSLKECLDLSNGEEDMDYDN